MRCYKSALILSRHPGRVAVAGALTIAFSAILVREADVAPATAAVFRCAYALPALGLLAWIERRRYGPRTRRELRLSMWAGVFFAADLICWHYAIHDVGAGLATVLGNLQVVLVGLVAWLTLGERPDPRVIAAVPIALFGILLISGVLGSAAYGNDPARGVVFGIATGLTYAGFILVLRQSGRDLQRPVAPLFEATAFATVFALIGGLVIGDIDLVPSWPAHGWLVLLALSSQVVGWLLISLSLPRLPAALTSVLLTVQPVGSVILGVILLGESPSLLQLVGVACIFSGIIVATARRSRVPA
ncbi:MAG TPA: DMT family transporter [Thermoleophilaceae bacterium]|nr:DMT family transporter [Thermoleophilaceae bacterium]